MIAKLEFQTWLQEGYETRKSQPPRSPVSACRAAVGAEVAAEREARSSILSPQVESTAQEEKKGACPVRVDPTVAACFPAVREVKHTSTAEEEV